ncbi:unannotated protein [freshwater metagenome]|uniref:Unannotated protein n=1 Tax=freshwater metagenome TaxID=449393 RepID=A0A6J6HBL1_9ZZZZ
MVIANAYCKQNSKQCKMLFIRSCCAFPICRTPMHQTAQAIMKIQSSKALSTCLKCLPNTSVCLTGKQLQLLEFSITSALPKLQVQCSPCNEVSVQHLHVRCVSLLSTATPILLKRFALPRLLQQQHSQQQDTCQNLPTMRMPLNVTICGLFQLLKYHSRRCMPVKFLKKLNCQCASWRIRRVIAVKQVVLVVIHEACCAHTNSTRWKFSPLHAPKMPLNY